jgi:hypothetical protein
MNVRELFLSYILIAEGICFFIPFLDANLLSSYIKFDKRV